MQAYAWLFQFFRAVRRAVERGLANSRPSAAIHLATTEIPPPSRFSGLPPSTFHLGNDNGNGHGNGHGNGNGNGRGNGNGNGHGKGNGNGHGRGNGNGHCNGNGNAVATAFGPAARRNFHEPPLENSSPPGQPVDEVAMSHMVLAYFIRIANA
jgi:hypothetical protein